MPNDVKQSEVSAQLRDRVLDSIRPLVTGRPVALLDFPNHSNCGDSAIWMGEEQAFADLGVPIIYRGGGREQSFDTIRSLPDECVLTLCGGGNFGDLYPVHQRFRENLLRLFPERRIIQLPQSVHFDDQDALKNFATLTKASQDFTVFVRDDVSLRLAEQFECDVRLCPDMAFAMKPVSDVDPTTAISVVARSDKEALAPFADMVTAAGLPPSDWYLAPSAVPFTRQKARGLVEKLSAKHLSSAQARAIRPIMKSLFTYLARSETRRGLDMIQEGRVVLTDRLHGHILAELSGRPHVAFDSGHGKVANFHDGWLRDSDLAHLTKSGEEAIKLARELAN